MDERDLEPEQAAVRLLVDQLDALLGEVVELRCRSFTSYATWCMPGPALREELADGVSSPSGASSSTRLSPTRTAAASTPCSATVSRCSTLGAEEPPVGVEGLVEVLDGDAEMVDPLRLHASGC